MSAEDVQLVERYGGKIVLTSLGNNWGRGRNLILKQCTSNWILQLDLDERVNDFPTVQRMIDANQDAWMTSIDNLQLDGTSLVTETIRIFKNVPGMEYWGYLHETVDDAVRKLGLLISYSPVKFTHYGYLQSTPAQLWDKMQRYFEINLKQMEDFPMDGRSYYNAALHLLEDNLINDGLRCLEISHALFSTNPLISMELGKTHLKVSSAWFQQCLANFPKESPNVPHIQRMIQGVKSLITNNYCNAPGHCISYLMRNPVKQDWFRKHLLAMTTKIEGGARKQ
jgi:hypothetical protein